MDDDPLAAAAAMNHFTEEERQDILNDLLALMGQDDRLSGVILVGSAAEGFDDRFSDIDLSVVVDGEHEVATLFDDWKTRIAALFPVLSVFEVAHSENMFLSGFLLTNILELDIGFLSIKDLLAKQRRWKIVFDRSGQIEEIMRSSWENREPSDRESEYRRRLDSIWHYITHTALSIARGHRWRAIHYLDVVRVRSIELACIRRNLDPHHFRPVHLLPPDFLDQLQGTLPKSAEETEIFRALRASSELFFNECSAIDQSLGKDLSSNLRAGMNSYLEMIRVQ
ncbi:MAG TPA: nucleotidyltransferase domain-containing protein [candidate division Zixibacteria bacterium]|nr:nucleotidyltransferase domain-containing protein [candidate division Zixibacteria bacterium]